MADIFISHSSKDKLVAETLVAELEAKGLKCWIAPRDILPGSEWAASINNAISETKVMIVIYSCNSASSTQVSKELNIADRKDKFIIPYMIDGTELLGSFEYFFTGAHWVAANPKVNDYKIDELYGVIAGVLQVNTQNVTNNTYIDNVTINHVPYHTAPAASAQKKFNIKSPKGIALIAAVAVALAAVIITPIAVITSKNGGDAVSANADSAQTQNAETISYTITVFGKVFVGTYTGGLVDGAPDGMGEFTGATSDNITFTYNGEFKMGVLCGTGTGEYADEYGVSIREGEWANNALNGQGKYTATYTSGDIDVLEGEWKDGNLNGYGTFKATYAEGDLKEETYEGEWKDGNYNGQGKYTVTYTNGDIKIWEGEFVDGKNNGYGTFKATYAEGDVKEITYEGEWKDDNHNGQGKKIYTYTNGDIKIWEGEFVNGALNGYGTFKGTYAEGDIKEITYEGEWKDDKRNGQGKDIYTYTNGNIGVWEGEFVDGKLNGYGTFKATYAEGDLKEVTYEGEWKDDNYNGQGKLTKKYTNGEVEVWEGLWIDGEFAE